MLQKAKELFSNPDRLGMISAFICLIHCLLTPLFMGVVASEDHLLHAGFIRIDFLFLLIGILAVHHAAKNQPHLWLRILLWSAIGLLAVSIFWEGSGPFFQISLYVASGTLILAHAINYQHLRRHVSGKGC